MVIEATPLLHPVGLAMMSPSHVSTIPAITDLASPDIIIKPMYLFPPSDAKKYPDPISSAYSNVFTSKTTPSISTFCPLAAKTN